MIHLDSEQKRVLKAALITGKICGIKVETIEDLLMEKIFR